MKLRIRGDSIRLRLARSEVKGVEKGVSVREITRFPGGANLEYILEIDRKLKAVSVSFVNYKMKIGLPLKAAQAWARADDQISIKEDVKVEGRSTLSVLVEKDFVCLKPRQNENEDESDLFFNPNTESGHCV